MREELSGKCFDCSGLPGLRQQQICYGLAGISVSPLLRAKYIAMWQDDGLISEIECEAYEISQQAVHHELLSRAGNIVTAHRERVGTALKARIEKMLSIKSTQGCGCATLANDMDAWGIKGCEKNREKIVNQLVENRDILVESLKSQGKWIIGPLLSISPDFLLRQGADWLLTQAIEDARENAKPKVTEHEKILVGHHETRSIRKITPVQLRTGRAYQVSPVHVGPRREISWGVCFTIAPRNETSWQRAVQSCQDAGWKPICFAEPGVLKDADCEWVQRPSTIADCMFRSLGKNGKFGAHQNYMQALADTLAANPDAEMILYAQDDAFFPPGSKEFLESLVWPEGVSLLSLWCPSGLGYPQTKPGLCRTPKPDIIGAIAFVMPRATAEFLVSSQFMHDWQGNKHKAAGANRRILDIATGRALATVGQYAMYFTHSIADHFEPIPGNSSIGNGPNTGFRKSHRYVGDKASFYDIANVYGALPIEPVHVVIPAHEGLELTLSCIAAVRAQSVPVHICYVDNGSSGETVEAIRAALDGADHTAIWNGHNAGFTTAVQQGIDCRNGRQVLVLNNDCRMQPGCLAAMLVELSGKVASVCPVTNDRGACSDRHSTNKIIRAARTSRTVKILPWFCCLLNRDALSQLDQLPADPEVASGLGVDDWWCKQLSKKGWQHKITGAAYAEHDHSATFKALGIDRGELQQDAVRWLNGK